MSARVRATDDDGIDAAFDRAWRKAEREDRAAAKRERRRQLAIAWALRDLRQELGLRRLFVSELRRRCHEQIRELIATVRRLRGVRS